jgi:dihydrofolate reductase
MRKIILYAAQSLDGFIASPDGSVDWLFTDQDYGYEAFLERIDTTLIGRKTYEQILTFGPFPYAGKENTVFTSQPERPAHPDVHFTAEAPENVAKRLLEKPGKDIWLVGGAQLNTALLEAGLVHELILAIHPILLGSGVPLLHQVQNQVHWALKTVNTFSTGMAIVCYEKLE